MKTDESQSTRRRIPADDERPHPQVRVSTYIDHEGCAITTSATVLPPLQEGCHDAGVAAQQPLAHHGAEGQTRRVCAMREPLKWNDAPPLARECTCYIVSMRVSVPTRTRLSYESGAEKARGAWRSMGHPCKWKLKEPAGTRDGLAETTRPALKTAHALQTPLRAQTPLKSGAPSGCTEKEKKKGNTVFGGITGLVRVHRRLQGMWAGAESSGTKVLTNKTACHVGSSQTEWN